MPASPRRKRLLILGGTTEAADLASRLAEESRVDVIISLAGRTRRPATLAGEVRVGGFGGADGLAAYLIRDAVDIVVDATHPFAATISANAARACAETSRPRLLVSRPPWQATAGDQWSHVETIADAATQVPRLGTRAFLTVGRQELAPFADCSGTWFLVRMIDPPDSQPPLTDFEVVLGRGPFSESDEAKLLKKHRVDLVISKNSGGASTYGKIAAARGLGIPVLMVARPAKVPGPAVETAEAAVAWVERALNR